MSRLRAVAFYSDLAQPANEGRIRLQSRSLRLRDAKQETLLLMLR